MYLAHAYRRTKTERVGDRLPRSRREMGIGTDRY